MCMSSHCNSLEHRVFLVSSTGERHSSDLLKMWRYADRSASNGHQVTCPNVYFISHYSEVTMSAMASQITGISGVCSTVCWGAHQRQHQSSSSLAFVREIHRWPVNSPHKGPVTRKMFPFSWRHRGILLTNSPGVGVSKPISPVPIFFEFPLVTYWTWPSYLTGVTLAQLRWHLSNMHDDVIKWKHFPRNWPFVRGIHRSRWSPHTKASDAELWCFLWSGSE